MSFDQPSLFPGDGGAGGQPVRLPRLWLADRGPDQDVVISSRMRLARNVDGFHFRSRYADGESERLQVHLRQVLADVAPDLRYHAMGSLSATEREVLFERHLVSREHLVDKQPRGVAFDGAGTTSVLVNEEDHLRLQVFAAGFDLDTLDERVRDLDRRIAGKVEYCFNPRFGYLTSCPTNTGTGLRVSVMLHLPALSFRAEMRGGRNSDRDIVRVHNAAQELHLTIRGIFGENSNAEGNFYQISNQVTLGRTAEETVEDVRKLVQLVYRWERDSRDAHLRENRTNLEDFVWRAWGALTHARRISSSEALGHLSAVRLGLCLELIGDVDPIRIQQLMVMTRPGHLQMETGRELSPEERDAVRAQLIRTALTAT